MMKFFSAPLFIAAFLFSHGSANAQDLNRPPRPAHVVVIGIDALSTDGLQFSRTPNIDTLIRRGAISLATRAVMPTVSAPNWSSMLTGAGPEQHGITKNGWTLATRTVDPAASDRDGFFPSIFQVIREGSPGAKIGMFYDWDELANFFNMKYIDSAVYSGENDYKKSVRHATRYIISDKPLFTFLYIGHPDNVGHEAGHGTERYRSSIEEVDAELGGLFRAMKDAGLFDSTIFFVVTDHGGVGKGHGGESMAEMEVPWIVSGPGVTPNRLLTKPNNSFNTAPTVAWLLGLDLPDAWVGRPVNEAFENTAGAKSYVAKPRCSVPPGVYLEPQRVELTTTERGIPIRYTTDGTLPGLGSPIYREAFRVDSPLTVRAVAVDRNGVSAVTRSDITVVRGIRSAELAVAPSPKYSADGALTLIDGVRGSDRFGDRKWLGFEGDDLEIVFDFGAPRSVDSVSVGCLNDTSSWIFLPAAAELFASPDGKEFRPLRQAFSDLMKLSVRIRGGQTFTVGLEDFSERYLKVVVKNTGVCPPGHSGEGKKAWLFVDEVIIR